MKWYMTVGYPGGEFAARADDESAARKGLRAAGAEPLYQYGNPADWYVRPCPPDLAEWIDFGPMWSFGVLGATETRARKVPGGYALHEYEGYQAGEMHTTTFIPVQGAQNITVLQEPA